ncbi:MAG: ATP-dependent zinc metalloprotease FtsH, partial [Planctomycetota bacterium]
MTYRADNRVTVDFTVVQQQNSAGNVAEIEFSSESAKGKFREAIEHPTAEGETFLEFTARTPVNYSTHNWDKFLADAPEAVKPIARAERGTSLFVQILVPLIPWILLIGLIWFFFIRQLRNVGGPGGMLGNFGRSKHRMLNKEHTHVTFTDVAGVEEAKDEVEEIVEFLKNPKKFQRLGGRIPRGVLLVGPPGTGKTLLAKAIAGEADVPFFSISGSDFVEMFVGVGASRVRDLFKQAKDNAPCIIFLDEIDAVGRRRGGGFSSGGNDEREQTLNAILVEMDGFETNDQVIVIASTNRMDVLDPALTRPGRFDRQVQVQLPDVKGRMAILKVHARKIKLGPNVDLARLAKATPGFSGADLAAIINESALGATLAGKDFVEQEDMEEARDKVRFGRAKKSRVMDEKDKLATAYHEAGHAVVQVLEKHADPLHKVTIIPRGPYGGATMSLPEKDRSNYSRKWCLATMRTLFAGRIAEEMFTGDVNTGVLSDIQKVTEIAKRMVTEWGMNDEIGFVYYGDDKDSPNMFELGQKSAYSDETARRIDHEVKGLIDRLYAETEQILTDNKEKVDALAKALMKYETLDTDDVNRIMRGEDLTRPTVNDLLAEEKKRRGPVQPKPAEEQPDTNLGGAQPA